MVDNIDKILPLLNFESPDDFYYLQILQRKKENPQLGSNSRVIKNYYINSREYLVKQYHEIKELCQQFNARASIRLNKRSYEKVAYKAMVNMSNSMMNREFSFIKKSYDRAVGQGHNDKNRTWILDIDSEMTFDYTEKLTDCLNRAEPVGVDKLVTNLSSKSGKHIITRPFDLREFRELFPEIDIHKDNPTNIYIP